MSESRIIYTPHPDATSESGAVALAAVYRFLLDHHTKKKGTRPGALDDVERRSNEIHAKSSIPK